MKKILVAVDGSPASISAAKTALELARATGGEVTLVHVEPQAAVMAGLPLAPQVEPHETALARGASVLKHAMIALDALGIRTENRVGPPAEVIADLAEEQGFELVVVGNKGRGAVSRVLLGSVADRLVHICKRPLLVVR
ncbi:MAG: universal stress protein [Archangiaceae bacterium]|nr:universal stress protein [Archangiaceae bacterium]